jgi:hypothetical protein
MTKNADADLSRRSVLMRGAIGTVGAATMLTTIARPAMASKLPKAAVSYQTHPRGKQRCAVCALFEPPHSCKSVAGTISPNGWCQIFRPK